MVALYIVRHGEAANRPLHGRDADRELTVMGKAQIRSLAKTLKDQGEEIGAIYHSPYVRTTQTAKIIREVYKVHIQPFKFLEPDVPTNSAINILLGMEQPTLVVSHIPLVASLVQIYTGEWVGFSTGTCAKIDVPDPFTALGSLVGQYR